MCAYNMSNMGLDLGLEAYVASGSLDSCMYVCTYLRSDRCLDRAGSYAVPLRASELHISKLTLQLAQSLEESLAIPCQLLFGKGGLVPREERFVDELGAGRVRAHDQGHAELGECLRFNYGTFGFC